MKRFYQAKGGDILEASPETIEFATRFPDQEKLYVLATDAEALLREALPHLTRLLSTSDPLVCRIQDCLAPAHGTAPAPVLDSASSDR